MIRTAASAVRRYGLFRTVSKAWRLLTLDRPSFYKLAQDLVRDKSGCEIGGPSFDFGDRGAIPIYKLAAKVDNFQYSEKTLRADFTDRAPYQFHPRKPSGITFIREAFALGIPAGSYDFVLSSHTLEHCANPIKVLREWQRVSTPGAAFILSVPYYKWQFDHRRQPTPIEHMLKDYARDVGEGDMTHFPEIRELHDHPSHLPEAEPLEVYWEHARQNFTYRELHHHVFDANNMRQLLEAAGLSVIAVECVRPFHVMSFSLRP